MEVLDLVAEIDRDRNQLRLAFGAVRPTRGDEEVDQLGRGTGSAPSAVWTNMKPPAPNPVNGLSVTNEVSTAQTAASTAFPPSRSTCAGLGRDRVAAATTPRAALTRRD